MKLTTMRPSSTKAQVSHSVLQMPADISVLNNAETRELFEELWQTPTHSAIERFKLFKLAWDLLGTDFAGRHMQYERFYMGPASSCADTTAGSARG